MKKITKDKLLFMYRKMQEIRQFEEAAIRLFQAGELPGFLHAYIGEEGVGVGVCSNLRDDDYITSTHRGHGHVIAKGARLDRMMAELFAKQTGYCKGKGGSMHIADFDIGILGANGIVGGGIPMAAGAGLGIQMKGEDRVVVSFFGDGASNNGTFHEGLNMASVWNLPAIFVCENNTYAESTPQRDHQKILDISSRAAAYDMPGVTVNGNDVMEVHQVSAEAIDRARSGGGPTLIECKTFRFRGHFIGDPMNYMPKGEVKKREAKDPIPAFKKVILEKDKSLEDKLLGIEKEVQDEIEKAIEFAKSSPDPQPQEAYEDLYV